MQKAKKKQAHLFYGDVLSFILESKIPFLVGGGYAFREYTGIHRDTKDLDIFCKTSDYERLLNLLAKKGWKTEITDARWIAKAFYKEQYIDIIFSTPNGVCPVDSTWFAHATVATLFEQNVRFLAAEELIWCKLYLCDRPRFDGADVQHLVLKTGKTLDWERLLMRMEAHWELLLTHLLLFRFVYPADRTAIPHWVMNELLDHLSEQLKSPLPKDRICRGPLLSRTQYEVDIKDWGYQSFT